MKRGFTLVELLVSVALMAALTSGVVSLFGQGSRRSARDARRQTNLQSITSGLAMYRNDQGFYPECVPPGTSCNINTVSELTSLGYLQNIPTDPSGGTRIYRYTPMTSAGGACNNPGTRCARFTICAGSEKDTTTNNNATCGGAACGGAGQNCVFVERNQ